MEYCEGGIRVYYLKHENHHVKGEKEMNHEIRELNRMICKNCEVKGYDECKKCKVYRLINKIAEQ